MLEAGKERRVIYAEVGWIVVEVATGIVDAVVAINSCHPTQGPSY